MSLWLAEYDARCDSDKEDSISLSLTIIDVVISGGGALSSVWAAESMAQTQRGRVRRMTMRRFIVRKDLRVNAFLLKYITNQGLKQEY